MRTLAIRIPLKDSDPYDIITAIDLQKVDLIKLVTERFEDIDLTVESGDREKLTH